MVFIVELLLFSINICQRIRLVRNLSQSRGLPLEKKCAFRTNGLVLGFMTDDDDVFGQRIQFTPTAAKVNERNQGKLLNVLRAGALPPPKLGEARMLYGIDEAFPAIALVSLGDDCKSYSIRECIDEKKEAIRTGVGAGVRAFTGHSLQSIYVDSCYHAESAAEGAALGIWFYQELRHHSRQIVLPRLELYDSCDYAGWRIGLEKAAAQNLARHLQETPRNLLTPSNFAQSAVEILSKAGINVEVKMKNWAKLRNLNAFLSVSKGSCEPPVFLETSYEGCDPNICPIVMIGKGCTFDSGGLCKRDCEEMQHMRGDMSGAACVVATLKAVSTLQLPVNIRGLIPLCENSFGASSYKPGDVYAAVNDKTIVIEDTAYAGVLMLADTLNYAKEFNPKFILDIGTVTPEMQSALGSAAAGAFSNCDPLYEILRIASIHTGDRVWRMPLWKYFRDYVTGVEFCDLTNEKSPKRIGGPCKAASFLKEFLPKNTDWIHIDNYGVSTTNGDVYTYLRKGMSGRPTRTLIEFIAQLACQVETKTEK